MPPSQRPASAPRAHSSSSSTSTSSSISTISSASSAAHSSPHPSSTMSGSSNLPSALDCHPARRTAGTTSPLLMFVHPHAPIHTPIPPSLRARPAPNASPFIAAHASEEPWYDNAEFHTPTGAPASAPCSACSSPLFDPRPVLPFRKSADSATFPLHSQRH
jgi:hypothetical protein